MYPFDTARRLMMCLPGDNPSHLLGEIVEKEGVGVLWRGFFLHAALNLFHNLLSEGLYWIYDEEQ